ncbi:MAG: GntR family transcriptional regulator [Dysosmobacter sp.]|nr:GntR family transcriptional regulator [Dysosmobacter sp.]
MKGGVIIRVNHNSPVPLYYQLREQIRDNILSGKWEYGKELPSELRLCETLGLSRATVKQAMDELVREGLIERKRGKGTFVTYQNEGINIFAEPSLVKQMEKLGISIHSRVISAGEGPLEKDISGYFEENSEDFCKIRRVRYIKNCPMILEENYISKKWARDVLKQNLNTISVYGYLEQVNGIHFDSYHIDIRPALLTTEDKQLLGLEDARVQLIILKKDIVGMRFDLTASWQGDVVMFNRRLIDGKHILFCADYDAGSRQFTMASGKILLPSD